MNDKNKTMGLDATLYTGPSPSSPQHKSKYSPSLNTDDTYDPDGLNAPTHGVHSLQNPLSAAPQNLADPHLGLVLADSYQLTKKLGAGGMGSVYLADHTRTGGQLAVKLIHNSLLASPKAAQRFELEARHTASLNHPNIVRVFDYGCDQNLLYQAMEYVPGISLAAAITAGRLPWKRVVRIVEQVLTALQAAHEHERCLIHRDIKPANILLTDHAGYQDVVKVVDFGISRALNNPTSMLTTTSITGSPSTMAPEQWQGLSVSPATDLYGLGCTTYILLAGRAPFIGDLTQLPNMHTNHEPPHLSSLAMEDTPDALVQWVAWLMRKLPQLRPQSARQALDVLRSVGTGQAQHAQTRIAHLTQQARHADPSLDTVVRLPSYRTSFVGRRREMFELDALRDQNIRLITIRGIGGLGKSRLSVEWARTQAAHFPGGVYFCDLAEATNLQDVCINLSKTLDVPLGRGDAAQTLDHVLSGRGKLLLILDNFEQIVHLAPQSIGRWLDAAPNTTFIATTRQTLGLSGERTVDVWPLSLGGRDSEAVQLFVDRARQIRADFAITDANADDTVRLVERLDGLPLAIELAAARIRAMSPARMVSRLDQRFKLLRSSRRDAQPRQATLKAMLDWSWELLTPAERAAFMQCAVFQGSFALEAAEAVIDLSMYDDDDPWVIDILESLVDKSLIRTLANTAGEERYAMFVSVHAYAQTQLEHDQTIATAPLRDRHLAFMSNYGAAVFLESSRHNLRVVEELHAERDNLNGALDWAIAQQRANEAGLCALALAEYFQHRGPYAEGSECLQRAIALRPQTNIHCRLQRDLGILARSTGQLDTAEQALLQALELARTCDDPLLQAQSLYQLGFVLREQGQLAAAQQRYKEGLAIAQHPSLTSIKGQIHYGLGIVHTALSHWDEAQFNLETSLTLARSTQHKLLQGGVHNGLGWLLRLQGQFAPACEHYRSSLDVARTINHKLLQGSALFGLADCLHVQGRLEQALGCLQECVPLARNIGHKRLQGNTLYTLGLVQTDLGQWSEAEQSFNTCLALARDMGIPGLECYALLGMTLMFTNQGRFEEAHSAQHQGLTLARSTHAVGLEGQALWSLASLHHEKGELELARTHFESCLDFARNAQLGPSLERLILSGLGTVLAELGETKQAELVLQQALRLTQDAHDRPVQLRILLAQVRNAPTPSKALTLLQQISEHLQEAPAPLLLLEHDLLLADIYFAQHQDTQGRQILAQANAQLTALDLYPQARLNRLIITVKLRAVHIEGHSTM